MSVNRSLLLAAIFGLLGIYLIFGNTVDLAVGAAVGDTKFTKWDYLFKRFGNQYSVPWRWLKAICMQESSLGQNKRVLAGMDNPEDEEASKSSDGKSWGLMQVTKATAKGLTGREVTAAELNDPVYSVQLAAMLVKQLISRYGIDDAESVFRDYNGGPKKGPLTLAYWAGIQANLTVIEASQPGDVLEY